MVDNTSGHRSVPHTADLRIEVWSPSRVGCIGEAVLGTVESFLDTSLARSQRIRQCRLTGDRDDDLLLAVLEEVPCISDRHLELGGRALTHVTNCGDRPRDIAAQLRSRRIRGWPDSSRVVDMMDQGRLLNHHILTGSVSRNGPCCWVAASKL